MDSTMKPYLVVLLVLIGLCPASALSQAVPSLSITSPITGDVIEPGQTLVVQVSGQNLPPSGSEAVTAAYPIGLSSIQETGGSDVFQITIPVDISPGSYPLKAVVTSTSGVIQSASVTVKVLPTYTFDSIKATVKTLLFTDLGHVSKLVVEGVKSGAVTIVDNQFISFTSDNASVVSVDGSGHVTPLAAGSTQIHAAYNSMSATVNVTVAGSFIILPVAATPTFSPGAGTFTSAQKVVITDSTAGATVHYTIDGTAPTASSTLYSGPITVSSSETIQAIAVASGYRNSPVASAIYTIDIPVAATPTFSPVAGTFMAVQKVTLSVATAGAAVYYTTDNTTPGTSSTLYSGPITVSSSETIQAVAVASGYSNSPVASATYTIDIPVAATPTFSPAAGTFTSHPKVTLADATAGAAVHYTIDGTTPTASSTLYSGPLTVSSTETIQAIAVATGYTNSPVASVTYTINLTQDFMVSLSASSLSIAPGQSGSVTVSIGPENGFSQAVSFTCSGLPPGAACSFSPATVTLNGTAAATTKVTVTASATAKLLGGTRPYELAGLLAGLTLFFARRRFRRLGRLGVVMILLIGAGSAVSCAGGSPATKTEPTTSTVSINATAGSLTHIASLNLTVQ